MGSRRTVALELRDVDLCEFHGGIDVRVKSGVPAHAVVVNGFPVWSQVCIVQLQDAAAEVTGHVDGAAGCPVPFNVAVEGFASRQRGGPRVVCELVAARGGPGDGCYDSCEEEFLDCGVGV